MPAPCLAASRHLEEPQGQSRALQRGDAGARGCQWGLCGVAACQLLTGWLLQPFALGCLSLPLASSFSQRSWPWICILYPNKMLALCCCVALLPLSISLSTPACPPPPRASAAPLWAHPGRTLPLSSDPAAFLGSCSSGPGIQPSTLRCLENKSLSKQ